MRILGFLLILLLISCSQNEGNYQAQMPSGLIVYVHSIQEQSINGKRALVLDYESTVDIKNDSAIHYELHQVWEGFVKKCEKAGVTFALIRPRNTIKENIDDSIKSGEAQVRWFYKSKTTAGKWVFSLQ